MALDPGEVEASWGTVWMTLYACADAHTLADFRTAKFRRARPKRSRVHEMMDRVSKDDSVAWCSYRNGLTEGVRAVCEFVRPKMLGCEVTAGRVLADIIEREFLEPR
jgi:hypothetical protein